MRYAVVVLFCMVCGAGAADACPERAIAPLSGSSQGPMPPILIALAISTFVGAAYAFSCSGAARLAHFRRMRARSPSMPIDAELATRVVARQATIAALVVLACALTIALIVGAPLAIEARIALLVVPAFVASVAASTLVRLRRFSTAMSSPGTTLSYDGGYYVCVVRDLELRAWMAATPAALARAHSVPTATALRV
ncbi:MAG: hypothetical protein HOV81_16580 [Kofleriaceae bacterium]|nr:hypothetical protein [Kofleriaceae bacterium]